MKFETKEFKIPNLKGISEKNVAEHLNLYKGYVANANLILEKIEEYSKDLSKYSYEIGELYRRFSFEFNGVRNHEYFFSLFEDGFKEINKDGLLYKKIVLTWGSFENFMTQFEKLALTRGIGWAILNHDSKTDSLFISWVDEQHLGQLNGVTPILVLDMWEHAYYLDYSPSLKKNYISAFFENINWEKVENNFN